MIFDLGNYGMTFLLPEKGSAIGGGAGWGRLILRCSLDIRVQMSCRWSKFKGVAGAAEGNVEVVNVWLL